ncbi:hypothetical protein quinque_013884 [Culex quinquefasciatus]
MIVRCYKSPYSIRRLRNLLLRYNPSVSNVRRRNPPYHTRWQKTRQVATCRKKRDVTNALKDIPSGPTRPSGPRGRSSRNDNFRNRQLPDLLNDRRGFPTPLL